MRSLEDSSSSMRRSLGVVGFIKYFVTQCKNTKIISTGVLYDTDFFMKIAEYCIMDVNEEFLKSLGKRIDALRKEKGLSFQELAIRSEMEKANLVKLTTQGKNITVNTLYNIAKGLDVELKEIFD